SLLYCLRTEVQLSSPVGLGLSPSRRAAGADDTTSRPLRQERDVPKSCSALSEGECDELLQVVGDLLPELCRPLRERAGVCGEDLLRLDRGLDLVGALSVSR